MPLHLLWMVEAHIYGAVFQEEMTDVCEILVFLLSLLSFNGSSKSGTQHGGADFCAGNV